MASVKGVKGVCFAVGKQAYTVVTLHYTTPPCGAKGVDIHIEGRVGRETLMYGNWQHIGDLRSLAFAKLEI